MYIIELPPPVLLRILTDKGVVEKTATFLNFLAQACSSYQEFANGFVQARKYDRLMTIIEACEKETWAEGQQPVIRFEDSDYELLTSVLAKPEWITPDINRRYIPFYTAFEKAQKVEIAGKRG